MYPGPKLRDPPALLPKNIALVESKLTFALVSPILDPSTNTLRVPLSRDIATCVHLLATSPTLPSIR